MGEMLHRLAKRAMTIRALGPGEVSVKGLDRDMVDDGSRVNRCNSGHRGITAACCIAGCARKEPNRTKGMVIVVAVRHKGDRQGAGPECSR